MVELVESICEVCKYLLQVRVSSDETVLVCGAPGEEPEERGASKITEKVIECPYFVIDESELE